MPSSGSYSQTLNGCPAEMEMCDIFRYHSGDLLSDKDVVRQHAAYVNSERPVLLCDLSDVLFKWTFWQEHLPRVKPFYAVKCNYDAVLLGTLARLGAGFDCASKKEIEMVRQLNVDQTRIIFAQPVKFIPHLRFAEQNGVQMVTFDRASELDKIKKYFPTAKVILRIRYDAKDVMFKMGDKFGCDPVEDGPEFLRIAKSMDLNVVGVSFHVGTGCNDIETYREALNAVKVLMEYGSKELGFQMTMVDIGGGFHGTRDNNFKDIAKIINDALDDFFPDPSFQFIAEPGQFFTTSAFTLITSVQSCQSQLGGYMEYIINDGIYNSFRSCPEILKFLEIEQVGQITSPSSWKKSIVRGQCPDSRDLISGNVMLPELKVGDKLAFRNIGSYSISMQSTYGGFDNPVLKYFIKTCDAEFLLR